MKTSSGKKRPYIVYFFICFILFLLMLVFCYEVVKAKIPQMNGELKISGLSAPVEVLRDQSGVPHITAKNNRDAFRALGFIMASERLFQMEISRRLAAGELAEVFGEKALSSDKLFRNLGLKKESQKTIDRKLKENSYDPEMLAEANAFYDGINQFIATETLPVEFLILGIHPKKFGLVDGQSFIGLMGFSFGIALMTEPLLTKLASRLGGDLTDDLRNEKIPASNVRVVDNSINEKTILDLKVLKVITDLESGFPLFEGSNGWLLAGKKSKSGFPILSNDPHISFSHPGIWFEAHIKTPQYESYGHFLSLIPFPILSHNRERAWGLTMTLTDDMDIFQEKIDTENKTYLFKGKKIPLTSTNEIIKVKKNPDYKMTVYKTHHGPVLEHAFNDDQNVGKTLSLQWAFYNPSNDPLSSVYKMGQAKNMQEFKAAVATGIAPGLNILYADRQNIGWWMFGEVWKKRKDLKRDFILNGENGLDEIMGSLTFDEKPHLENPASGMIVSANNRPSNFPPETRGDWQPDDRFKTIESILAKKDHWSPEELMELQTLNMNFENKILLQTLLAELHFLDDKEKNEFKSPLEIITNWNLVSDVDSVGASLYYSWTREIQVMLLKDLTSDEREIFAKVPNGWIFFKRVLLDHNSVWWKKFDRTQIFHDSFVKVVRDLKNKYGDNEKKWEWGKLHTLEFVHPIGRLKPLNLIFNLGPYPAPGATQEINNLKFSSFKDEFLVKAGPSTRRIIDFAHPEISWGILPTGNSGHMLSPFYDNQVKLFLAGKYRPQLLDLQATSKEVSAKMKLLPSE